MTDGCRRGTCRLLIMLKLVRRKLFQRAHLNGRVVSVGGSQARILVRLKNRLVEAGRLPRLLPLTVSGLLLLVTQMTPKFSLLLRMR